ncbi:hypothetical protein BZG02_15910 [Labilibaculum filiforme]|uniref:Transglycosylase SLT domain-containing protein n=1 Tax=Labilibaculum filiforme TaxID=1940526 RepID=A0A2N3HTR7_9BACT|nr:hypothetical protein [Labilibaculum filiforme]PKQ61437.1 hypothetical protein BZG02_15910 [Labilibaculum filiforme]
MTNLQFWSKVKISIPNKLSGMPADMIYDPIRNQSRKRYPWDRDFEYEQEEEEYTPFPISPKVYHFHPIAFVEQMRRMEDDPSLIWGLKFTKEERQKVIEIANGLWGEDREIEMANNLMAVFAWESGGTFRTDAPNLANSGGTGLIQFMPPTAKGLLGKEITIETVYNYWGKKKTLKRVKEFADMTVVEQLGYVGKYFKPLKGKTVEFVDFYLQVLFPISSGKPDHIVFSKDGKGLDKQESIYLQSLRKDAYEPNKGMDLDKDGKMWKKEIKKSVQKYLKEGEKYRN